MKTIIYCRKSSEDSKHQVLSIPSQESNLKELAERNNLVIHKTFHESMSAKQPGRPQFEAMIKLIKKNPGSTILVWKLDRLARNPVDDGIIKWLLQQSIIKCIMTPERNYYPEDNALIASVEFGMANQYVRDLSRNVKRGIKTKLENGGFPGQAPFGYINDRLNHTVIPDEKNKHWIPFIFKTYATGKYSIRSLTDLVYKKGLRTPSGKAYTKAHIHKILNNHFYYGTIVYNEQHYDGAHTPLISKKLFFHLQEILKSPNRPRPIKRFYPLRGFLRCAECGCAYTADTKKDYVYYYCTNGKNICSQHQTYLRKEKINRLIAKTLKNIKFDKETIEIASLAYKEKYLNNPVLKDTQKKTLINKLNNVQIKINNLIEIISNDPDMKDAIKPKLNILETEKESIELEIKALNENKQLDPKITFEQTKKAFLRAYNASFDFIKANDEQKHELLNILLSNVELSNQKVQCFQFKQPYQLMAEAPKKLSFEGWLGDVDSNHD